MMMADGVGGPKDDVAARGLFEKAAAQGHAGALERMGAFAQAGRGGPEDKDAAKAYYEKAAALGNEDAKGRARAAEMPLRAARQARQHRFASVLLIKPCPVKPCPSSDVRSTMSDQPILHHFEASPFSEKIRIIFGFKQSPGSRR